MKKAAFGMLLIVLLVGIPLLSSNVQVAMSSEPPAPEWTKTYGGTANDYAFSIIQTPDRGYAIAGYTNSFGSGGADFWLVKTDEFGNHVWNKTYGGPIGEKAYSVIQTDDGGYAIAGRTRSYGAGMTDMWLVKTDEFGNHVWNKTYGGPKDDIANKVVQTIDGGYALAGETSSYGNGSRDFWLVKTNSTGDVEWNQTYGGTNEDEAYSVIQTSDGGYAIVGRTLSFGPQDFWLVKTNSTGDMEWHEPYGGVGPQIAFSVVQTSDGGYAIGGENGPNSDLRDVWLVKTDASGNMQWNKTYGVGTVDISKSMVQTADGGYVIAGWSETPAGSNYADFYVIKTDADGNMQWNDTYGGAERDEAYSVIQTSDGGYAIVGYTGSYGAGGHDFWLVKLAPAEIDAMINVDPDTLNLKSNGQWITAYITLPEGYSVEDVDVSTVELMHNDVVVEMADWGEVQGGVLMVKFDRATLRDYLGETDVDDGDKFYETALTVTGNVAGAPFKGSDTIIVKRS